MTALHSPSTKLGALSGGVLTYLGTIEHQDYVKAIVLAIIGAFVSFFSTLLLKWLFQRRKRLKNRIHQKNKYHGK